MAKILVIDDDIPATLMLEKILTLHDYEAVLVSKSSEAVQTAKSSQPNLILLDLMMPEPNGFEICRTLREDSDFEKIPIVIISALGDYQSKEDAYTAGATDYMTKPLHMKPLINKIRSLIE